MTEPARGGAGLRNAGLPVARRRRTGERLVALLLAGTAALNFPLLSLFHSRGELAGIPALFLYLFAVWFLLAAGTALVLRRRPPERDAGGGSWPEEP